MAHTHKSRLFGDSLPDVTLPCGDCSSFVTLKALFRRTGSIHAEEPARRTPELFWEASPVVERRRPAAQARIARDRIVLVDAAQDRVIFYLAVTELLHTRSRSRASSRMSVAQVTSQMRAVLSPDCRHCRYFRHRGAIIILPLRRELRDLIPL